MTVLRENLYFNLALTRVIYVMPIRIGRSKFSELTNSLRKTYDKP